ELDDLARSCDASAVDMTKAKDGALDATGARLPRRIAFDVELRPPVLARRPRMAPLTVDIHGLGDQFAVHGNGTEVHQPLQGLRLQQPVHELPVPRVRLPWQTARRLERAVDDDVAVVEHVRFAGLRRERPDANLAVRRRGMTERGAKRVAHDAD